MESKPLVTIILQTYNRRNTLETALNSAINQTYENIEVLIGDNCSEDGTEEYCIKEAEKDSRIKYFRHSKNIGMVGNANFLSERVTGKYTIYLNDDDWLDNDYVEKCVEFLENNSDYSMVSPSSILYPYNYFDFTKKIGKKCKVVKLDSNSIHNRLKTYLKNQDIIEMATGCFRTSILEDIKNVEGQYIIDRYNEDIIFFMKFLVKGKCKVLKDTHINKRDGGFSKDLKSSDNVYTTNGITLKNIAKARCELFSDAIRNDKYIKSILPEKDIEKLYKRLHNSLLWFYCEDNYKFRKIFRNLRGSFFIISNLGLFRL